MSRRGRAALRCGAFVTLLWMSTTLRADVAESTGDRMLDAYFAAETARHTAAKLADLKDLAAWKDTREKRREELREMLGLSPLPPRSDLQTQITGRIEHEEFFVEKLHYQSLPGLYVGASLYVPRNLRGKAPAILYVCGHAAGREDKATYGAKANYQHHGAWFARHGYVCLTLDTIQLGELEGVHQGTSRFGLWWWGARGYTPAGVEVWNAMRALDYLESRPEVDGARLGMTGRSGGGSYTWMTAALDDRVQVAVPVSGMIDLQAQVADGRLSGHCDCMFTVNTYGWDFPVIAALVAPRPLLLGNCDQERGFPLPAVLRLHAEVAAVYRLYGAEKNFGLSIAAGTHRDSQDLQVPTFRWFNRFLKQEEAPIRIVAEKLFRPSELRAFPSLPADERTTTIHETFVPLARPTVPTTAMEWARVRDEWRAVLREKSFRGWPSAPEPAEVATVARHSRGGLVAKRLEFTSQGAFRLPAYVFSAGDAQPPRARLHVLDDQAWNDLVEAYGVDGADVLGLRKQPLRSDTAQPRSTARDDGRRFQSLFEQVARGELTLVCFPPRGIGPTAWTSEGKPRGDVRRRLVLLGQTLEGMRVWDIARAMAVLRQEAFGAAAHLELAGDRHQAVNALYASLFADGVSAVELIAAPASHRDGPDYLNVLRFLDVPQALAMAAERQPVRLVEADAASWSWAVATAQRLQWPASRIRIGPTNAR